MFTLSATTRSAHGTGASRRLRHANKFPAIIYGGNEAPVSIELDHDIVMNMQNNETFYLEPLTIEVNGKATKVKVQAVQRHAYKPKILHMDFVRV